MWLIIAALVVVAIAPKGVWIGLGVIGVSALIAYLAIKHPSQKGGLDAHQHEPTLAELIAKNEPQRSARRPQAPSAGRPRAPDHPLVESLGHSSEWRASTQVTIDVNREHAPTLCDKFPPTSPRTNEQISAPAHPAPPAALPPRAPQKSIPPAETHSGSQTTDLPDQLAEWNVTHQATIEAIRACVQALSDKFPVIPPRTNEQISALVEPAASLIILHLPTRPRVSERAITPSSPPATPSPSSTTNVPAPSSERTPGDFMRVLQGSPEPERMFTTTEITNSPLTHALPTAPADYGEGRWISPGESIEVAGVNLPGGMIYVGGRLKALNGGTEPCLISGQCTVARVGNYRARQMGYWPSYIEASPEERRAYLNWLSEGRSHPDCDIGYVFLFFYGLERRVIVDSRSDPAAQNDWPAIIVELRRLLAIYGEKSGSFKRYAGELLRWIELDGKSSQLYKQPVPDFPRTYELPPYLRLALGQAAVDRAPLPAHLALAWIRLNPECYLRTAATRCPNEFERLFTQRYHEALGPGLMLPENRTKLKFVYQAASAGLRAANITMAIGDVPDVTALTAPIRKLMEIASQCTDELGSYSRLVGKDPGAAGTLEGQLLLPSTLWPDTAQAKLRELTAQLREGRLSLPLKELFDVLGGANQVVNRDRVRSLARALEGAEIGMEPHVLGGAKAPREQDTVVLFTGPLMDSDVGSRAEYQMAALTLQLASAVAQADGEFHDLEVAHLRGEIEGWVHLTLAERRRLHAHLQWLTDSPMNLSALKRKLEPLPTAARETLAAFMAALVQANGIVSPDEVKFLEKVYKALGVEPKRVFSDIHAAGSGGATVSTVQAKMQGFRLDTERIAALQEDTVRVSALLSKIFAEEADSTPAPAASAPESEIEDEANAPLGLDPDHSALLHLLLSRPEWTRNELEDAAADLDLMLDGAMEQINEAAFEAFAEPLFDGEDPISVNTKLLEKIEA
ncbi:MAG: tellurite resistance TerB family protein [Vulcanimicrobiaceae bacterium]